MLISQRCVPTEAILCFMACCLFGFACCADDVPNARRPEFDADLRYWLENMVWYHRFSDDEIMAATGLNVDEVHDSLKRFQIMPEQRPHRDADAPLLVMPYPGGRHPRIGFLDGAIDPQRETKVSVFTPWDEESYVVVDVPEAIWSNLGLTYLAHTHVPTVWTNAGIELKPLEWERHADGTLTMERELPNGISFGTKIQPRREDVLMEMWLKNGTDQKLTDLRVQNCVMLKAAKGFTKQDNANKVFKAPFAVCHDETKTRWIITAWDPCHRPWGNAKCPCLHSDPKFPDCEPCETVKVHGWLSFYEGKDLDFELGRIEKVMQKEMVDKTAVGVRLKSCWQPMLVPMIALAGVWMLMEWQSP